MTVIDAHLHLFRTEDEGLFAQGGVMRAGHAGVIGEVQAILDRGRIDRVIAAAALPVAIWRRVFGPRHPDDIDEYVLSLATEQNRDLAALCATDPRLELAAGADATLPAEPMIAHLRELIDAYGVRAIKIHPGLNFVMPADPGFRPVYELACDADLVVISHGGGAAEGLYDSDVDFCAPQNFVPVLSDFPALKLVVAHFAHPYADALIELSRSFPNLLTDLSFVVGADLLPGNALRDAIRSFGVERVLFGTDFPYFDPERSLDRLESSGLSTDELDLVRGGNAERILARER